MGERRFEHLYSIACFTEYFFYSAQILLSPYGIILSPLAFLHCNPIPNGQFLRLGRKQCTIFSLSGQRSGITCLEHTLMWSFCCCLNKVNLEVSFFHILLLKRYAKPKIQRTKSGKLAWQTHSDCLVNRIHC